VHILGVSALYHDSAAALVRDGQLVAAAQEERFTRVKYDPGFPGRSITFCLEAGAIEAREVDYVVFFEKPFPKLERILTSQLSTFPRSWRVFRESVLAWTKHKLWVRRTLLEHLPIPPDRVLFSEHHVSHGASAMFCSPFEEAAVLTADGVGEWTTTALGRASAPRSPGSTSTFDLTAEVRFPHSLGLLYSVFTAWLGFRVNSGEYKMMGLASYGEPKYLDELEKVVTVYPDGSYELDMTFFSFHYSFDHAYNAKFVDLFGPPRQPERPFFTERTEGSVQGREAEARENQRYADVAASVQRLTETILLRMADHLHRETGLTNLVMAGGVALNSVANGRVMRESPFERVYIQPNAGDAGGALGAAMWAAHVLLGEPGGFVMEHAAYGQSFSPDAIRAALAAHGLRSTYVDDVDDLAAQLVDALVAGEVLGLFGGRFEWGPRALGHRSILADPRQAGMKSTVNEKVKFREQFRPFGPAVSEAAASTYFDFDGVAGQFPQRFMLMVTDVRPDRLDEIPAVSHMGTARPQVVTDGANPLYTRVIDMFGQATGVPVVLNTSFNLRGEPMVAAPDDAIRTFLASGLDRLVLDGHVVRK